MLSEASLASQYRKRTLRLRDGTALQVRPIEPTDRAQLAEGHMRLSEQSRYRRFFVPMTELSPEMLTYLTEVDHVDHEALVASDKASGAGIGVARYVRAANDPAIAEVAITVDDAWQGRGVATLLLHQLAELARRRGIDRFSALILADNDSAMNVMQSLGEIRRTADGGLVELQIELPRRRGARSGLVPLLRHAAAGTVVVGGLLRHAASPASGRNRDLAETWPSTDLRRVLVATDGAPGTRRVVLAGAQLAARSGARLHLVCAHQPPGTGGDATGPDGAEAGSNGSGQPPPESSAHHVLSGAAAELAQEFPGVAVETRTYPGDPARVVVATASEIDADLVVVGSSGRRGVRRFRSGGVAADVLQRAQCNVLVVKTD